MTKQSKSSGNIPGAVLHIPYRSSKIKTFVIQQLVLHSQFRKTTALHGRPRAAVLYRGALRSWDRLFLAEGPMLRYFVPDLIRMSLITINFRSQCWTQSFCQALQPVTKIAERIFKGTDDPLKSLSLTRSEEQRFFYKLTEANLIQNIRKCLLKNTAGAILKLLKMQA